MDSLHKVVHPPLDIIQAKLGMSLDDMAEIIKRTGLSKHSDIRWMLQREYGMDHEDAKVLVNALLELRSKETVNHVQ